ncbi:hypothetical protein ACOME3_000398 [Neoechinorhynchus agilis]
MTNWHLKKIARIRENKRKAKEQDELWHDISAYAHSLNLREDNYQSPVLESSPKITATATKWVLSDGPMKRWVREGEQQFMDDDNLFSSSDLIDDRIPEFTKTEFDELNLRSDVWTFDRTCYLLDMCRKYELRFPLVLDRWDEEKYGECDLNEIKNRFYRVQWVICRFRDPNCQVYEYDSEHEHKRRSQLQRLYDRSDLEVKEEMDLVCGLKAIQKRWASLDVDIEHCLNSQTATGDVHQDDNKLNRLLQTNCSIEDQRVPGANVASKLFNELRERSRHSSLLVQMLDNLKHFDPLKMDDYSFELYEKLLRLHMKLSELFDLKLAANDRSMELAEKIKYYEGIGGQWTHKRNHAPPALTEANKLIRSLNVKK